MVWLYKVMRSFELAVSNRSTVLEITANDQVYLKDAIDNL